MLTHLYIYKKMTFHWTKRLFSNIQQHIKNYSCIKKKKSEMYEVAGDQYKRQFYSYFANTL